MFRRSFSTPGIWIWMFSIGKNRDGKIFGIADSAGSVVNTDWNCLLRMSAFSWLEDLSADLSSESCWMPVVSCLRLLMYLNNALGFSLIEGPSLLLMKSDLASRSSFWTFDLMLRNTDQSFCAWVFLALLYWPLFLFDHSFDCSRDIWEIVACAAHFGGYIFLSQIMNFEFQFSWIVFLSGSSLKYCSENLRISSCICLKSAWWNLYILCGFFLLSFALVVNSIWAIESWSLIPGMAVTLSTRVGLVVKKRSKVFCCLVGKLTNCSRLWVIAMLRRDVHWSPLPPYTLVLNGLTDDDSQSTSGRLKSPARILYPSGGRRLIETFRPGRPFASLYRGL